MKVSVKEEVKDDGSAVVIKTEKVVEEYDAPSKKAQKRGVKRELKEEPEESVKVEVKQESNADTKHLKKKVKVEVTKVCPQLFSTFKLALYFSFFILLKFN